MTTPAASSALSYLARRGVAAQWRGFLRALVETLDANLDPGSRDSLMRAVGGRFAALMPLPPCTSERTARNSRIRSLILSMS